MKKIKKLLNDIRDCFPPSRREMKKVIGNMISIMDGFMTTSTTQSQVYVGLIKEVEKLKEKDKKIEKVKDKKESKMVGYQ